MVIGHSVHDVITMVLAKAQDLPDYLKDVNDIDGSRTLPCWVLNCPITVKVHSDESVTVKCFIQLLRRLPCKIETFSSGTLYPEPPTSQSYSLVGSVLLITAPRCA